MTKNDLETTGHNYEEQLDVIAHCDCADSAERWCHENVQYGWMNRKHWFSFEHAQDAQAFRDLWEG